MKVQALIALLLSITQIITININNYAYKNQNTISLVPSQTTTYFSTFYLPNNQTFLLKFYSSLKLVNANQPNIYQQQPLYSSDDFIFGKEISLVFSYSANQTKLIKSYQYPDKRLQNTYFAEKAMNSIKWVNSTTAVIAASNNQSQYLGIYQQNSDIIKFIPMDSYFPYNFIDIMQLQGDDILAIYEKYLYVVNLNTFSYDYFYSSSSNPQCIKTYKFMNQTNTTLTQYLLFKGDSSLIELRKRTIQYLQGRIVKTLFQKVISFQDLSFNCAFNFVNQSQIILINKSSTVILRSLQIPDLYIDTKSSYLQDSSIKVSNSPNLFLRNGMLQQLSYNYFNITTTKTNVSIINDQKKAWIMPNLTIVLGSNKTLMILIGKETTTTIQNILDCELVQKILFLLVSDNSQIKLITYSLDSSSYVDTWVISSSSSSITAIKLQSFKINNISYCLISYQEDTLDVKNWFLSYNATSNKIERVLNDTSASYDKLLIPSSTTFYITQDLGQARTSIRFHSLDDITRAVLIVNNYKWIRLQQTILVIYYENQNLDIYYFQLDFTTSSVNIVNAGSPSVILLQKMPSSIQQNHIFLLKDLRKNANPNNYIIFFYYSQHSYYYNTLDPILRKVPLKKFKFTPQTSLLINPQIIGLSIYFSFSTFQFVNVQFSTTSPQQIYLSCNLKSIFNSCTSVQMKFLNKNDQIISFLCETSKSQIMYFYNYTSFMNCSQAVKIKTLVYNKGVKSYDISPIGEIAIINIKDNNEYLDYYKNVNDKILPIKSSDFLCISNNGYYFLYRNGTNIFLVNSLMFLTQNTYINLPYKPLCTIDDSGIWSVLYQQNQTSFIVLNRNKPYKQVPLKDVLRKAQFIGNYLLIITEKDMFYFDKITKGNVKYLIKNNASKGVTIDFNGNYIAYSINQGSSEKKITICELGGQCFPQIILAYTSYSYIFRIGSDGKLFVYSTAYYYNDKFQVWNYGLKDCQYGSYISNGQCLSCSNQCRSCEAESGACLDCKTYQGGFIATLVLAIVFLIAIGILAWRYRKYNSGDNLIIN